MRDYLSTLHQRPDYYKRRFALAVSTAFTLSIFTLWSLANFGSGGVVATEETRREAEVSPLQSLYSNVASSIKSLKENFGELKEVMTDNPYDR
jgi:hypothetical protein